ncbi:Uncharacterised protein [Mycobacterium tuberculosis]|uniref:Uncharacterized protein n=1 Tax=Mycobacterium tuberculosis TaxID=1773 RepID=A0A655FA40_MYCTX|nr:Uncharacterised protein [Mycobacterium tuberculosis]CKP96994.1 Uncharacterised protein [Mycobacterium tuberculosis]CKQ33125.1 Uncharacterised protein [Mycobacterium tuberculosis]CKR75946.1 Uncharacterised protein [Mycobacterium tuberculosis]CKT51779.1 Uncharacterised protein [Mycobacterium tuberculosis]
MSSNPPASRATPGSRPAACSARISRFSAPAAAAPESRAAKYSSTVPKKATAIPTEQITTYFQVASSAVRVRRCPTRNAVITVVASIATQMTPMLLAHTARTIAQRNAGVSTPYSRALRPSICPCASSVSM